MSSPQHGSWPSDVGIWAMEIYFPYQYVDQTELETYDNVSAGKYTIGLGQMKMGFCSDREDINSLCLTVVHNLMDHYNVPYDRIGRIEVGTETILDKSKSVKSVLMQLFQSSGNTDVEGVDTTNACYGGTAALFNSLAWLESSAWDGRLALVVAGDIAVYASGNARPTGGAGAVAFLLGPNAPIVFDRGIRASHSIHVYDFYKPDLESEYPRVDGKLSIQCYLSALDKCYQGFGRKSQLNNNEIISLSSFDAFIFHSPYCKLVQKSLARLLLNDVIFNKSGDIVKQFPALDALRKVKFEDTYFDRDIEKVLLESSKTVFEEKTKPSLIIASEVGNMYTPSVYGGLVSHIINTDIDKLLGSRLCMFSYGSGLQASMYSLRITNDRSKFMEATLSLAGAASRLENRLKISPEEFSKTMLLRENNHHTAPYVPVGSTCDLFEGTYYLESVDEMHRRKYSRVKYVNGTK